MHVYLSLGSNLGDRAAHLRRALEEVGRLEGVRLLAVSHCYATEPVGLTNQPEFLNLAAEIWTETTPMELLNAVKAIEERLGREPSGPKGPRIIDIDLILWGDVVMASDRLTLPHPEFRKRNFVLAPLAEIAPEAVDPVTGKTVAELAASPDSQGHVEKRERITP